MIFVGLLVVLLLVFVISYNIYISQDHTSYDESTLKEDAKVISINTDTVGVKGSRKFRITVIFDDGFRFISHRGTSRENHMFYYRISISDAVKKTIVNEAIHKHQMIYDRLKGETNVSIKNNDFKKVTVVSQKKLWQCNSCGILISSTPCPYCGNSAVPYWCGKCGKPGPYDSETARTVEVV